MPTVLLPCRLQEMPKKPSSTEGLPPFGVWLRTARVARGWTMDRLAEEINSAGPVISNLERGIRNPSREMVIRLAGALFIGPEDEYAQFEARGLEAADLLLVVEPEDERQRQALKIADWYLSLRGRDKAIVDAVMGVQTLENVFTYPPYGDRVSSHKLIQDEKLDPYAGSGTFMQRVIPKEQLRKYNVFVSFSDDEDINELLRALLEMKRTSFKTYQSVLIDLLRQIPTSKSKQITGSYERDDYKLAAQNNESPTTHEEQQIEADAEEYRREKARRQGRE